ncbi:MAG: acyl-CoA synthetase [Acidimicrobiaceae bacterium]|nr:acyl-CoA synthetase [Acidimicrobiaceae bacterium]
MSTGKGPGRGAETALLDFRAARDDPAALCFPEGALSREELMARAGAVAARLSGAEAVAVCATPSLDTVVAVVAGMLAGMPVVPVPPDSGAAERAHILADSGASVLVGSSPWGDVTLPAVPVEGRAHPAASVPAGTQALIVYTSGTTGPPKGVPISGAAIAADLDGLADAWAWTAEDTLVHGLPLFHVHGLVLGVLGALRVGSRLVHTGRPRPELYAAAGGSLYFGVPTVWSRMCDDAASAGELRPARLLVSGSAPLPAPVFSRLAKMTGHEPVERYGMTETLITVSARADGPRRPGWVGVPLAGIRTRVVDDDGAPVDPGEVGELEVRGPTVMSGYLRAPEATAAAFRPDGWFRTGDVASVDEEGFHRIVGRRSTDLIKSGGYRIGAGEVEAALLSHPGVREAAVVGEPDDDLGQVVVAYVVADGVAPGRLEGFVAEQLSAHKRPRRVVFLDRLPVNAMGKVQKTKLGGS